MGDAMQARQHSDAENARHNEVHAPELVVAEHYPAAELGTAIATPGQTTPGVKC